MLKSSDWILNQVGKRHQQQQMSSMSFQAFTFAWWMCVTQSVGSTSGCAAKASHVWRMADTWRPLE